MYHLINVSSFVNKYIVVNKSIVYELCIETTRKLNNMQDESNIDKTMIKLVIIRLKFVHSSN